MMGVGLPSQRIVDLGTGTGALARAFAQRGSLVTGVDPAEPLLEQARRLASGAGLSVDFRSGRAEDTGLPSATFDAVTAGQCWHWFDRAAAAREARRLLRRGGALVIAHFDWIPLAGDVVERTEALIERYNPEQPKLHLRFGFGVGLYPQWLHDMAGAGFEKIETFSFDTPVPYTHEGWRGRIRASQGVGAMLPPDVVQRFDAELAAELAAHFPSEPMLILHRAFAVVGRGPL
jgi:SAM-dependent methyltransferase